MHPFTVVIVPGATGVTLSGGQQMRLALARVFYQQPQLIIADDPLAAVDAEVGQNEVPDSTISKDVSSVCSRRIEAGGQEVECRGLRARSKWAELAEI